VVRIEAKTTQNKSFSVTLDMIEKIETAAAEAGEMPVIVIEFNKDGRKLKEVAVCPTYVLESIVGV
jgi:Holliday junction resolvase